MSRELSGAIYVEFQNRLDDLIKQKQEESLAIEEILNRLSTLYTELDDVASLPTRMGFPDKGSFEFFTIIKNVSGDTFNDNLVREFSFEASDKIKAKIYNGWQDVPREFDRLKYEILLLSVNPKFEELKIDENEELMERIMKSILQNYKLN